MNSINLNPCMDLAWHDGKPTIFVNGEPFLQCSFLLATVPVTKDIISVDDLSKESRVLEGEDAMTILGMTETEVLQAHASNLIAWIENGYDTRILHSNLSFPLLKELARAGDVTARRVLQFEIESRLRDDFPQTSITIMFTCHDMMDERAWNIMAASKHDRVRQNIAHNLSTPARVLERLAGDNNADVRIHVADNPSTPARVLEVFANDDDANTRMYVAGNPNTPEPVLERLAIDKNVNVRHRVFNARRNARCMNIVSALHVYSMMKKRESGR